MPTADENNLNDRLERRLPHLLVDQPYNYRQELSDFLDEEAELDQDIDRVWNQAVAVNTGKAKVARFPQQWWGAVAACLVATVGLVGVLSLGRVFDSADKTGVFNTLRGSRQPVQGEYSTAIAAQLQKRWQPGPAATQPGRDVIIRVRIAPADSAASSAQSSSIETRLTQSSGDPAIDRAALAAASNEAIYRGVPAGKELTLNFDLASRTVSVTGAS